MTPRRARVANACRRCRRQKLKCDSDKPCTLCIRAGVQCVEVAPDIWKSCSEEQIQARLQSRSDEPVADAPPLKKTRTTAAQCQNVSPALVVTPENGVAPNTVPAILEYEGRHPSNSGTSEVSKEWKSSSTLALVEEAFNYHDVTRCHGTDNTVFQTNSQKQNQNQNQSFMTTHNGWFTRSSVRGNGSKQAASLRGHPRSAKAELFTLLPPSEAAKLLIDTYFDRVHWFTLLFHQDDFRSRFQELLSESSSPSESVDLGFLSTVLAVCVISLQYSGPHREQLLIDHGITTQLLRDQILAALERRLLDILALSSLESVQTCILIGTYYLYHGEPDLAWPICGCGLRIAQALSLHRKIGISYGTRLESIAIRAYEARKRCWWAIYEVETFCSMLYGFPLSISDSDCDVEHLNPLTVSTIGASAGVTLLSYKYHMSKLSVIVKTALTDLYARRPSSAMEQSIGSSPFRDLVKNIKKLDKDLRLWQGHLPTELSLDHVWSPGSEKYTVEELDKDIGASGDKFNRHVFQLQALSLRLAYENAMILVHRPLLSYKMTPRSFEGQNYLLTSKAFNPCKFSIQQCHQAALQISHLGSHPIFQQASRTYAVAVVGTHLFTAGITLCIVASLEPLSNTSHESKLGLQRLMQLQASIKSRSSLTDQALSILKKLIHLTMEKETSLMLNTSQSLEESTSPGHRSAATGLATDKNSKLEETSRPSEQDQNQHLTSDDQVEQLIVPPGSDMLPPVEWFDNAEFKLWQETILTRNLFDFDSGSAHTQSDRIYDPSSVPYEAVQSLNFTDQEQGWIWSFGCLPDPA